MRFLICQCNGLYLAKGIIRQKTSLRHRLRMRYLQTNRIINRNIQLSSPFNNRQKKSQRLSYFSQTTVLLNIVWKINITHFRVFSRQFTILSILVCALIWAQTNTRGSIADLKLLFVKPSTLSSYGYLYQYLASIDGLTRKKCRVYRIDNDVCGKNGNPLA